MRSLSPKARRLIEHGIAALDRSEYRQIWLAWSKEHPSKRSGGPVNQAQDHLPAPLAQIVLAALDRLLVEIGKTAEDPAAPRDIAIRAANELGFIRDLESEVIADLKEELLLHPAAARAVGG